LCEIKEDKKLILKVADYGLAKNNDMSLATLCGFLI
jgi:hypothetical protein